jgi:hypothetical protein
MSNQDPEPRKHLKRTHESRQTGRTTGDGHERSPNRTHGGASVTLRIKPDRRRSVTRVAPEKERRRR